MKTSDFIFSIIYMIVGIVSMGFSVFFVVKGEVNSGILMFLWASIFLNHVDYMMMKEDIDEIKKVVDWKEDNFGGKDPEE